MSAFLLQWSIDLDAAIAACSSCERPRLCAAHAREADDFEAAAENELLDLEARVAELERRDRERAQELEELRRRVGGTQRLLL